jgi:hypothetical protein
MTGRVQRTASDGNGLGVGMGQPEGGRHPTKSGCRPSPPATGAEYWGRPYFVKPSY